MVDARGSALIASNAQKIKALASIADPFKNIRLCLRCSLCSPFSAQGLLPIVSDAGDWQDSEFAHQSQLAIPGGVRVGPNLDNSVNGQQTTFSAQPDRFR